ncbi:MAG: GIY-YIG nuclease family protein [Candidatus Paceibacterota bacterium]
MTLYDSKVKEDVKKFPDSPGVYIMRDEKGEIIYIGKATSLRKRVSSYFFHTFSAKTKKLVSEIRSIDFRVTDNVMEALILEANLIGFHKPRYNIKLKDDKYFVNIIITDEKFPRVLVIRASEEEKPKAKYIFGPYVSKRDATKVTDFLIKIFCRNSEKHSTASLYRQYYMKGYNSGKVGDMSSRDYGKIINYIRYFLEGRKNSIIKRMEVEMKKEATMNNFEQAAKFRDQLFALKHIRDTAFLSKDDLFLENQSVDFERIEGYDISNISGEMAVGSMVVFRRGKPDKDEYRKFKIKTVQGANDVAMMKEVLERRFGNNHDWQLPEVIIMDGGITQTNVAKTILKKLNLEIPIVGIAKGPDRKGGKLFFSAPKGFVFPDIDLIKKVRDESHRFAINYHRKLRSDKIKKSQLGFSGE